MKSTQAVLAIALCFIMANAFAQKATRSEVTVEEEYFGTNEDLIIIEMVSVDDYETKMLVLQYIKTALDEGRTSPAIEAALHNLAGEGIFNESRTNRRLSNNFTEVRRQACMMLADIKTEASKSTLLRLMKEEEEPMVLSAAIYALGSIGLNTNDDVTNAIAWVHKRIAILRPTDSLAYSVLDAYEKLSPTVKSSSALIETISSIATNYSYVLPVRQKAKELLLSLKNN